MDAGRGQNGWVQVDAGERLDAGGRMYGVGERMDAGEKVHSIKASAFPPRGYARKSRMR